jgi:hypothetical protein
VSLTLLVATHVIILASDLSTGSLTGRLHRKLRTSNAPEDAKEEWNYVTLRSATTCTEVHILSFGSWLEPRYIFAAGQLKLDQ